MNKGWIKIYRSILDCAIWEDGEPYDRRSAWIDLLLLCNHADKQIIFNGEPMTISRGQYLTSVRKLSERWHWSNDRTLRYLRLLEQLEMIKRSSDNSRTLLTLENYGLYQDTPNTDEYTDEYTRKDTHKDSDKSQTRIKECKERKNSIYRHKYGYYKNVLLSDEDMEKLKAEFPTDWEERIEKLSSYMASTGKSYKNHLATIRNWARKDKPVVDDVAQIREWLKDYDS